MIEINSTRLLPLGVTLYAFTEEEYKNCKIAGRVFRLTHTFPVRYVEIFVEPEKHE